jgi:DNA-binding IscR family transcriptional regulator
MRGRKFKHLRWKQAGELVLDAAWLLPLVTEIARAFQAGKAVTAEQLGRTMQLPQRAVRRLVQPLEEGDLVRRVDGTRDGKTEAYCLARPSSAITVGQILRHGESLQPIDIGRRANEPAWRMVRDLHQHWHEQGDHVTLDELLIGAPGPSETAGPPTDQVEPAPARGARDSV